MRSRPDTRAIFFYGTAPPYYPLACQLSPAPRVLWVSAFAWTVGQNYRSIPETYCLYFSTIHLSSEVECGASLHRPYEANVSAVESSIA